MSLYSSTYLAMFIVLHALQQAVQEVPRPVLPCAWLHNPREHVAPDGGAPHSQLVHDALHEGHHAGKEVDESAVVHLPEDVVKLLDVVGVFGVGVVHAGRVAEVAVEYVGAGLPIRIQNCELDKGSCSGFRTQNLSEGGRREAS